NFKAYNINFVNGYGAGAQAVAVTANGNKQGYYGCSFKGYQDTLYAKSGLQYYSNCYVEGAVDYIFGKAAAWFGECIIASNGGGYITANSRETSSDTSWYVFDHSTITAASGASVVGKVYLGRPWRVLARVIYQNSVLTNVVNAAGWTTMADGATPIFQEYNNSGAGSDTSKRHEYFTAATSAVSKNTLWGSDWQSWVDTSY
ncbi:carbohydrate esterase family 8 protein, partial [Serendipita vermifera MAFF 305830]